MLIALATGGGNAFSEQFFGFRRAVVLREGLGVHLISGHVVGIGLEQSLEVRFGARDVAFAEAFECNAVAGKRVVGILSEELLQLLAAGIVLFRHGGLAYYTGSENPGQRRRARESDEGKTENDTRIDG